MCVPSILPSPDMDHHANVALKDVLLNVKLLQKLLKRILLLKKQ